MADRFFSERNLKFLLYEVFDTTGLTQYEGFRKHNRQVFDMIIDACIRLAKDLFKPCLEEMDRKSPELAISAPSSPSTFTMDSEGFSDRTASINAETAARLAAELAGRGSERVPGVGLPPIRARRRPPVGAPRPPSGAGAAARSPRDSLEARAVVVRPGVPERAARHRVHGSRSGRAAPAHQDVRRRGPHLRAPGPAALHSRAPRVLRGLPARPG